MDPGLFIHWTSGKVGEGVLSEVCMQDAAWNLASGKGNALWSHPGAYGEPQPVEALRIASRPERGEGVNSERELMLEDARSISEGVWRKGRLAQDAAESLDVRIEDKYLDGVAEAVEAREALESLQTISLEISEELDAYQQRHAR
jgi:hypothetical protein